MVYRPQIDKKLCFVLMPLREPFLGYYEHIIKPAAADVSLDALRSDEIYGTRPIIHDIWDAIWRARVIVADVTSRNPNVNYELGLCHSLGVPTILLTQSMGDVPFDYRHRRCIEYHTDRAGWESQLRDKLKKTVQAVLSGTDPEAELTWPYDTHLLRAARTAGDLLTAENTRGIVIHGAELVRKPIASSFGPLGSHVRITLADGIEHSSRSGVLISRGIRSSNALESKGIESMRQIAQETYNQVGDGSKIAVMLAHSMLKHGHDAIEQGHLPKRVTAGMERAVDLAQGYLTSQAKTATGDDIMGVAQAAAGGDDTIARLVATAIKKVGSEGVIQVDETNSAKSALLFTEGMQFDRGYLSEHFVNDPDRQQCLLENCRVLVHEGKFSSMRSLLPILEFVAKEGAPLLIIAGDLEGEALATLVVNSLRGTLSCAAVKAPAFAAHRTAILEDIAVFTGSKAFTDEKGLSVENATLADLGHASRVTVNITSTTLFGGRGKPEAVEARAKALRAQLEETQDDREREILQTRLANLLGKIAIIQVGGGTATDIAANKYKATAALHSARCAIEEGVVFGGGLALCNASKAVRQLQSEDEAAASGIKAVASALDEPLRVLIENSGRSPTQVLSDIESGRDLRLGFNALDGRLTYLDSAGILDSAMVLRHAVTVALSHAKDILETGAWDLGGPAPQRAS